MGTGGVAFYQRVCQQMAEASKDGTLTVEDAWDLCSRLPEAVFLSMMETAHAAGKDPRLVVEAVMQMQEDTVERLKTWLVRSGRLRAGVRH